MEPLKKRIWYRAGYKYQLAGDYIVDTMISPEKDIKTPFIELTTRGRLTIRKGYAWDGPSGPALDTPSFMRASLVHDALYQLIREEHRQGDQAGSEAGGLISLRRASARTAKMPLRACQDGAGARGGRLSKGHAPRQPRATGVLGAGSKTKPLRAQIKAIPERSGKRFPSNTNNLGRYPLIRNQ